MNLKKFFALFLVLITVIFAFCACGEDDKQEESKKGDDNLVEESAQTENSEEQAYQSEENATQGTETSIDDVSDDYTVYSEEPKDEPNESDVTSNPNGTGSAPENPGTSLPAVTLVAKNNGDGTVTVSAKLPSGIGNGKIVLTVSDKLEYVSGSAKSDIGGAINDKGDFNGIGVSFATTSLYDEGSNALIATYKLSSGATLTAEDFWCDSWELGDGTAWVSNSDQVDEIKICK